MKINPWEFDQRTRTIFRPVYPLIAEQILASTPIRQGCCLDIGCGGGYLGLALAEKGDFYLQFLDRSGEMLRIAEANLAEAGLAGRGRTIQAWVEKIPLPGGSVDLAVSRGSVFFWGDLARAFGEIHRVLAPGGMAYIGGGFGSAALRREIGRQMDRLEQGGGRWRAMVKRNMAPAMRQRLEQGLTAAAIPRYAIKHNQEEGTWILIRK